MPAGRFLPWLRLRGARNLATPPSAAEPPSAEGFPQGLFIIGAARSGTTVLQNALNASPEIFLLGEPALHRDGLQAGFADRYNRMHRAWGNQPNKSSYCPPLFDDDPDGLSYLRRLATMHRYVGSKIVINPQGAEAEAAQLLRFHNRHFYRARYLFAFRDPVETVLSTRALAEYSGAAPADYAQALAGQWVVLELFVHMLRNLPGVRAFFQGSNEQAQMVALGHWLALDLHESAGYYDQRRRRHYAIEQLPARWQACAESCRLIQRELALLQAQGFPLAQLEQNNHHLDPQHFTPLGQLARRIALTLDDLRRDIAGSSLQTAAE